jgi:hypothetical protein
MVYSALSYFGSSGGGRTYLADYYIRPFHFHYFGFDWVEPWPGNGMHRHFAALAILAVGILIGFLYRISSALFCLGWVYLFLLDKAYFQNHFYLVCLLSGWIAIFPANRAFSLDVAMRPSLQSSTVPAWVLWVLRADRHSVFMASQDRPDRCTANRCARDLFAGIPYSRVHAE